MKLLLYSRFFFPSVGGVKTAVLSLTKGLVELPSPSGSPRIEITLVTNTPAGDCSDADLPFRVIRRPGIFQLRKLIREADVVHLAGPTLAPMLWGLLLKKPAIVEHHGYQAICPTGMLLKLPELSICPGYLRRGNYDKCPRCLAQESGWLRACTRLLLQFRRFWLTQRVPQNVAITYHVKRRIDLPVTSVIFYGTAPAPAGDDAPLFVATPSGKVHFALVGRLVVEKGAHNVVAAAKILRDQGHQFLLSIIGDGPERSRLEVAMQAAGLQDSVRFLGFLRDQELVRALVPVQVIVMPSICEETAGLSAMENMLRGRLVIASAIGGLQEMVGEAALLAEPGSAASLAECMSEVIKNPALIVSYGQKGRDRAAELFQLRTMIDGHAKRYEKVFPGDSR